MLELKNINVSFRSERQDKIFGHTRQQVLFDVSLAVKEGTCLGILGESGSGKSTMGRVLCGLLKPDSGEAVLDGVSVYASRAGRRNLQNKLSIVFQDYTTSANPRFRIRDIIGEGLTVQERREGKKLDRKAEISRLLELVGLPADFADRFPHELSGGQLQRVCIARAVACKPEIILFDEAISSLDAHTQVQVMDLLRELKDRLGLTYIFITHRSLHRACISQIRIKVFPSEQVDSLFRTFCLTILPVHLAIRQKIDNIFYSYCTSNNFTCDAYKFI